MKISYTTIRKTPVEPCIQFSNIINPKYCKYERMFGCLLPIQALNEHIELKGCVWI